MLTATVVLEVDLMVVGEMELRVLWLTITCTVMVAVAVAGLAPDAPFAVSVTV